jgi:plasmid stabilization system protein ParE
MKVRLTPQANSDLELIRQYLFQRSPIGATRVLNAIHDALKLLAEHPYAAQGTEHQAVRSAVVRRYPYRIFYAIADDAIEVLHIRHTSRRPWSPPQ